MGWMGRRTASDGNSAAYERLPDDGEDRPAIRSQPGRSFVSTAKRYLVIITVFAFVALVISVVVPKRPDVRYVCTMFDGVHLDRSHAPYFYVSFKTFARVSNPNFYRIGLLQVDVDIVHWDDKIAQSSMEPRGFSARSTSVELIRTNASDFSASALQSLWKDMQDGIVTIELRGKARARVFAHEWRYTIANEYVHLNLSSWDVPSSSTREPCPPVDYKPTL